MNDFDVVLIFFFFLFFFVSSGGIFRSGRVNAWISILQLWLIKFALFYFNGDSMIGKCLIELIENWRRGLHVKVTRR